MNCIVPGANLKVLSKAIMALSKIGDELFLEAKLDELYFMAMNSSKTVFAEFKLKNTFFSTYEANPPKDERLTCKIPMKSMLNILKKSPLHKDKKIEMCKIELESDANTIIFKFRYKTNTTIVHSLYLIDYEALSVLYDKKPNMNCLNCTGSLFTEVLSNFVADEDISFEFSPNKVILRNYDANSRTVRRDIRSQIPLASSEFEQYSINEDTNITLSLKPLKSAIGFAEFFGLNLNMLFEVGGRPALIEIKNAAFSANYILATVNSEGNSQTTVSTNSSPQSKKETRKNNKKGSSEKQQTENSKTNNNLPKTSNQLSEINQEGLENVDWSDFGSNKSNSDRRSVSSNFSKRKSFSDIVNQELSKKSKSSNEEPQNPEINENNDDQIDFRGNLSPVLNSQECPLAKKAKLLFGRCHEMTFHPNMLNLGKILAPDSDPDSDSENR